MMGHIKRLPPLVLIAMLTCVPHLLFILAHWHAFPLHDGMPNGPTDPDPWLRLTQMRAWLSGGGWYDHFVTHTNAPFGGITTPWTRPVDLVIAGLTHLMPGSWNMNDRLLHAALLVPWIWMTLLVWGIYRIIALKPAPLAAYLMGSLLLACTPTIWNYFGLGNVDHHAPLCVLFILAMGLVLHPAPTRRMAIVTGILLGLQLWISVEALILIAAIYAWYGIAWLRGRPTPLAWLATSTAITSAAALMIERPKAQWLMPIYDSISIVHVAALGAAALVAYCLYIPLPKLTLRRRAVWACGYIGAALVVLYATYPLLFAGPMVDADPYIFTHFLPNISEAQPFYNTPLTQTLANFTLPLIAIVLCAATWLAPKRAFYSAEQSAALLFFLGITLLLNAGQARWSYYLLPLAVAIVAPVLGALFSPSHPTVKGRWPATWLAHHSENEQAKRRLPIIFAVVGLPLLLMLAPDRPAFLVRAIKGKDYESALAEKARSKQRNACYTAARQLLYSGKLDVLMGEQPQTILAPTDLGADIMFWSKHHIIASNYHREGEGIRYVWEANRITNPKELRSYLAQRDVKRLLLCPTVQQVSNSTLQGFVAGSALPAWLHKIDYSLDKADAAPLQPLLLRVD